ncbi:MAG: hypothetical protein SWY16_02175 [Cyanobacteriota bacterium]|nr:hypothetical protein [Cyanobacteriota bacterium]
MTQTQLLTALGCSGSLALTLMVANPASAMPVEPANSEIVHSEIAIAPITHVQDDLLEGLGCGCAVCSMSQPETM